MPKKDQTLGIFPRKSRGNRKTVRYSTEGFCKPDDMGIMKEFDTVTAMERSITRTRPKSTTIRTVRRDLVSGTTTRSKTKTRTRRGGN